MKNTCISLYRKEQEDRAITIYYGECLRIIAENTAKSVAGHYISAKLQDILNPKPLETRTAEEIIDGIRKKF